MLRRLAREETGIALVMALVAMAVVGSLSGAVLFSVADNQRSTSNDVAGMQAFGLAEDGLAYAEGRLNTANDPANGTDVPSTSFGQSPGTASYTGTMGGTQVNGECSATCTWTLKGTGTVGSFSRSVSAQVQVTAGTTTTTTNSSIWNYFYINSPSSCTSISGSVVINVPLYTQGGICMSGSAEFTGSALDIGGNLSMSGSAKIGLSTTQRISSMALAGTCPISPCAGSTSPIWVNSPGVGKTLPSETMPTISLSGEYANTDPGPASGHACQAGSGVPTPFFDNDTTLNNSISSVNLFPAGKPYDCIIGTSEIKWDGTSKLYVNGVFYFDGSLSMSGSTAITYTGSGSLYFTGGISLSGSTTLCGIANCTSQWNPNTNTIVLVAGCWANSTGSSLIASSCCKLSGSVKVQVGIYCTTDYNASGSVTNMGPVLTNTATVSGSIGQMIPITTLPPGAPANSTTTSTPATIASPSNFSA